MPTIVCDKCHASFEVPSEAAGTTVYCPKCGTPNGVPGAPPSPGGSGPVRSADEPERILLRVRPALFRARPFRYLLVAVLTLAGLIGAAYFAYQGRYERAGFCALVMLGAGSYWLFWKVQKLMTAMEVTTRRTIVYRGLFSKSTSEVRHDDIKNFQVYQSFLDRIFRVGRIGISSAGQEGIEIEIADVPSPYRVRETIDKYRRG
jgi:hypothetical protein